MEIVYAPKGMIPLASLVQFPPQFNSKYLCAVLKDLSKFAPKVGGDTVFCYVRYLAVFEKLS
ncbi:hypothetical protein PaeBR_08655 [Paenibacillus sp. BR2-3]|uniref:hypothetical protein n=1 Tax=Paenibacillus sp. BR2-3 TaxID=3048494 RepID=UPI003977C6AA